MVDTKENTYHITAAGQQGKTTAMGIHLAGANSQKTAIVCCTLAAGVIEIAHSFERVGPAAGSSGDDRILSILALTRPELVMVDCPLTLPPCLACQRPTCAGQSHCDDIELAYLLALEQQYPQKAGKKPVNPQIHRTWDIARRKWPEFNDLDPTFTLNQLPLVHRGTILQKRLRSLKDPAPLLETNVLYGLVALTPLLAMDKLRIHQFRSFELGAEIREEIISRLFELLAIRCDQELYDRLWQSLEVFLATVVALVAMLRLARDRGGPALPITVASYHDVLLPVPA